MLNVEEHIGLAKKVAGKMYNKTILKYRVEYDDVLQECCVALVKCAKNFDESKGYAFSSYAIKTMEFGCLRMLRDDKFHPKSRSNKDTWGNTFSSLDISVSEDEKISAYDCIGIEEDYSFIDVESFLNKLNERDRKILVLKMEGKTQLEIGKIVGTSQVQISRILRKIKDVFEGKEVAETKPKLQNEELLNRNAEIIKLVRKGVEQKQVAEKFGLHQSTVAYILKKARCAS